MRNAAVQARKNNQIAAIISVLWERQDDVEPSFSVFFCEQSNRSIIFTAQKTTLPGEIVIFLENLLKFSTFWQFLKLHMCKILFKFSYVA